MFETMKASIAALMDEIAERPADLHILQEKLREKISEMRAMGLPVPEDIERLEKALEDPQSDEFWKNLEV